MYEVSVESVGEESEWKKSTRRRCAFQTHDVSNFFFFFFGRPPTLMNIFHTAVIFPQLPLQIIRCHTLNFAVRLAVTKEHMAEAIVIILRHDGSRDGFVVNDLSRTNKCRFVLHIVVRPS